MKNKSVNVGNTRSMRCPCCHKRAFDVVGMAVEPIAIQLKCPHCKNIVTVEITVMDCAS